MRKFMTMKKIFDRKAALNTMLTAFTCTASAAFSGTNLVVNGTFDSGDLSPWVRNTTTGSSGKQGGVYVKTPGNTWVHERLASSCGSHAVAIQSYKYPGSPVYSNSTDTYIMQSFTVKDAGTYVVSLDYAGRKTNGYWENAESYVRIFKGKDVSAAPIFTGAFTPKSNTSYSRYRGCVRIAEPGVYTIQLFRPEPAGELDRAVVIDNVSFSRPEKFSILLFGHSYGVDSMEHLPALLAAAGIDTVHLAQFNKSSNMKGHGFEFTTNGVPGVKYPYSECTPGSTNWVTSAMTVKQAIESRAWDYVVLQESLANQGRYEAMQPYLNNLASYIRTISKGAHGRQPEICWNLFWPMSKLAERSSNAVLRHRFSFYGGSSQKMWEAYVSAAKRLARDDGITNAVPTGATIMNLRESRLNTPEMNEFTRDTYHLSLGAGRYAAACAFFEHFMKPKYGVSVLGNSLRLPDLPQPVTDANAETIQRCAVAAEAGVSLRLAPIFTDHMVVAADKPVRVFGTFKGAGTIKVSFRGNTATAACSGGQWCATLPPGEAGGPFELVVEMNGVKETIRDVMAGEVLVMAGQSNIQFKLYESTTDPASWISDARVRMFSTTRIEKNEPYFAKDGWRVLEKSDAKNWSAIGYETAIRRARALGIPVGVINCYQGASVIQSWLPESLALSPRLSLKPGTPPSNCSVHGPYLKWNKPGTLYAKQFSEMVPYPVSAVVWYQGEANTGTVEEGRLYADMLEAMIGQWRVDLGDQNLPFYVCELSSPRTNGGHNTREWRTLQESQRKVAERCPGVECVRTEDICEADKGIHPPTKYRIAERLCARMGAVVLYPRGTNDCTSALMDAVDGVRAAGGGKIVFAPGQYHFRNPRKMRFYVSNHNNPMPRNVFLPITNLTDVAFVGKGVNFTFHGEGIALALIDTRRVQFKGIGFDYARPYMSETRVLSVEKGQTVFRADPVQFPMEVVDGQLYSVGEGWRQPQNLAENFSGKTLVFVGASGFGRQVTALGGNTFRVNTNWGGMRIAAGDVLHIRSTWRPNPAICLYRAHDTLWEDCPVHSSAGMGLVAQRCENVTVRGSGKAEDRTAGSFARPGSGRVKSLQADATHFSNCKGTITVENCMFEGMVDDAINVHSTCLKIEAVLSPTSIKCRYMHGQSEGFETFMPGERLRGINARTLEPAENTVTVTGVKTLSPKEVELTLSDPLPEGLGKGDAVENADWQPAVVFRNNVVRNSKPRATLFTTPGKVVCEGNLFDHVAAQAVSLEGDSCSWYESGGCRDVTIRNNVFRHCLAYYRDPGRGVITVSPNVKDIAAQKRRYHRNILVENNTVEGDDVPLVRAHSVSNFVWRANTVKRPANAKTPPFQFSHSEDVHVPAGDGN